MDLDTSIGGNQSRFPETRRSAIVDLRREDPVHRAAASKTLIAGYSKPVYEYTRVRWKGPPSIHVMRILLFFFTRR